MAQSSPSPSTEPTLQATMGSLLSGAALTPAMIRRLVLEGFDIVSLANFHRAAPSAA